MNRNDYFSAAGFSASQIKMYEENPDLLSHLNSKEFKKEDEKIASKALFFGEVFHLAVLEPERFTEELDIINSQLQPKERELLASMLRSLTSNKAVQPLIKDANLLEHALFSKLKLNEDVSVTIKGLVDLYTHSRILIDLKTVASLNRFYYSFKKYRYDLQLALYKKLLEDNDFEVDAVMIIAAEKIKPFGWQCFIIPDNELDCGRYGNEFYRGYEAIIKEMHLNPRTRFDGDVVVLEKDM